MLGDPFLGLKVSNALHVLCQFVANRTHLSERLKESKESVLSLRYAGRLFHVDVSVNNGEAVPVEIVYIKISRTWLPFLSGEVCSISVLRLQERRALERKISELEEEVKVSIYLLTYVVMTQT